MTWAELPYMSPRGLLNWRAQGEVLTSSVLKDLVAGSGLSFEDRGMHAFKGLADEVRIFAAGTPAVM